MKKDYIFPTDNWYLKVTNENIDLVNDFRNSRGLAKMVEFQWEAIDYTSLGVRMDTSRKKCLIEITTLEFKEYVLNIQEPIKQEDLSYLVDFLNNNIK